MAVNLEGGCRVLAPREGAPECQGTRRAWVYADRATGTSAMSLRLLEFAPGVSPSFVNPGCDETLYLLEGPTDVLLGHRRYHVEPDTGLYVAPVTALVVDNRSSVPVVFASSRCPDPGRRSASTGVPDPGEVMAPPELPGEPGPEHPLVRLDQCQEETASDRWYKVLLDGRVGSRQVTQFVGAIPPGKAPAHYHEYEETLLVLSGQGCMWAGDSSTDVISGAAVYLPRRQVHCLENTGTEELRVLGVFYPAGSPAVSYAVD